MLAWDEDRYIDVDRPLLLGQALVRQVFLDTGKAAGWPHFVGHHDITEWGGTIEGIRALIRTGVPPHDRQVAAALRWLEGQQRPDGGWGSWEIHHSCTEATAWALLVLQMGERQSTECYDRGVRWLERSAQPVDGNLVAWGAYDQGVIRVYPTLLASWALDVAAADLASRAASWLLANKSGDGGWAFTGGAATGNAAMTAMVLYHLGRRGTRRAELDDAVSWLWRHQRPDGSWDNAVESWIYWKDATTGASWPTVTMHYTTPWALMALLAAGCTLSDARLWRACRAFVEAQDADGGWFYSVDDPKKHMWALANSIWALVAIREAQDDPRFMTSSLWRQVSWQLGRLRQRTTVAVWTSVFAVAVVVLRETPLAADGWRAAVAVLEGLGDYFEKNRGELALAGVSTVLIAIATYVLRRLWLTVIKVRRGSGGVRWRGGRRRR